MSEYIERDIVLQIAQISPSKQKLIERIKQTPTADVAPVVRCKDCKFNVANMERDTLDKTDYTDITCAYFMTDGMNADDYCSSGEEKGEVD